MSTIAMTQPLENPGPTDLAIEPVQRTAAKTVGFLYLFAMAISIFGESVRGRLILPHDAAQTASNIAASEALFRLSIAGDLIIYVCDIVLFWGLYVILKRVNKDVALLAVFFRLVETAILGVTTLTAFIALRLLSGADYLRVVDTAQLQALARGFLSVYGIGLSVGFVFLGIGSAVFSYLWLKSRYIPRGLAGLGIFASLLMAIMSLVTMVFPVVWDRVGMAYMMPMGLYEVGLGFWLLIKGIKTQTVQQA
jgi:Domain of unknown function (DUF4386)